MRFGTLLTLATLSVAGVAVAETRLPDLSVSAGVFLPSSATVRRAVGDAWFNVGISPSARRASDRWTLQGDLEFISGDGGGGKVFLAPVTLGLAREFRPTEGGAVPFVAVRAGLAYMDYALDTPGGRRSAKRVEPTANAEIALQLNDRTRVGLRYDVFPTVDGLRFDGLTLSVQYKAISFGRRD
ncbi:MAG: hypothetical protein WHU10_12105 [Fimbriimonadales bacterium]